MKHREYVYAGEPVCEINDKDNKELIMNLSLAVIMSLEKRQLITAEQKKRCIYELKRGGRHNGK